MTPERDMETVVVGAGPAGAMAALALARRGRPVLLLDRARFPRAKICGQFLTAKAVAALREAGVEPGAGGWDGWPVQRLRFSAGPREFAARFPRGWNGFAVERILMDDALARAAQDAGAELREETTVLRADSRAAVRGADASESILALRGANGNDSVIQARHLIAADGRLSRLGRFAGKGRDAHGRFIGVQAVYGGVQAIGDAVELHVFPGRPFRGYAGFVGLGGTRANLCPVFERDFLRDLGGPEAALAWAIEAVPALRDRFRHAHAEAVPLTSPCIETRRGAPLGPGGLWLVGDAAGYLEPFTGEGMALALRSGWKAGHLLADALEGRCTLATARAEYAAWHRGVFRRLAGWNAALRWIMRRPWPRAAALEALATVPPVGNGLVAMIARAGAKT